MNDPIEERVGTTAGFVSRALAIATDTVLLTVIIAGGGWVRPELHRLDPGSGPHSAEARWCSSSWLR